MQLAHMACASSHATRYSLSRVARCLIINTMARRELPLDRYAMFLGGRSPMSICASDGAGRAHELGKRERIHAVGVEIWQYLPQYSCR